MACGTACGTRSRPPQRGRWASVGGVVVLAGALAGGGCGGSVPSGSLVLTQTPVAMAAPAADKDTLDARYPASSRVVLVSPPFRPGDVRVLSKGLHAAGGPVVSPDGRRVFFSGKTDAASAWQVYEASLAGGRPRAVTAIAGGAMDAGIIAHGELVFCSPVPKLGQTWKRANPAAIYAQRPGGAPRRLTFGASAAVEPTVLADGRILFVSAQPPAGDGAALHLALFTVNNDGTEVTAFAGQHDGAALVHRPRELPDGQVAFLAANSDAPADLLWAECVRTANPFASRERLFSFPTSRCRSVEPGPEECLLACFETRGLAGRSMSGSYAVYQVPRNATALGAPLFDDPAWNDIEATRVAPRPEPMGHVSAMQPAKQTGTILCLNANFTSYRQTDNADPPAAVKVRVLAGGCNGEGDSLSEASLCADGSFMVEVPADRPLGFEALDAQGQVLRRLPPMIWVRSGENHSCIGCHEPHNRSPRNVRPLAVSAPPAQLGARPTGLALKKLSP